MLNLLMACLTDIFAYLGMQTELGDCLWHRRKLITSKWPVRTFGYNILVKETPVFSPFSSSVFIPTVLYKHVSSSSTCIFCFKQNPFYT